MNDTSAPVQLLHREMILRLSPTDRFSMGARMFESARQMMLASFPAGLSEQSFRHLLFRRLYGRELPELCVRGPFAPEKPAEVKPV
jgi:hypothetical protein